MSPKYVGFVEAIQLFFKNYANFKGRSTRSEFWFVYLANVIISTIFSVVIVTKIVSLVAMGFDLEDSIGLFTMIGQELGIVFLLAIVYFLATIVPSIALCVRRLHDVGTTGWWILIQAVVPFIPKIGNMISPIVTIVFIILFYAKKGEPNANQWGSSAEELEGAADFNSTNESGNGTGSVY